MREVRIGIIVNVGNYSQTEKEKDAFWRVRRMSPCPGEKIQEELNKQNLGLGDTFEIYPDEENPGVIYTRRTVFRNTKPQVRLWDIWCSEQGRRE